MYIARVLKMRFQGTLVTNGYRAYVSHVKKRHLIAHAEYWAHECYNFEYAQEAHHKVRDALLLTDRLYEQDAWICCYGWFACSPSRCESVQAVP